MNTFLLNRSLLSYRKVQRFISYFIRNKTFHIRKSGIRNKAYLNVGSGENKHEQFINLDCLWQPGIDICWDITKGIPIGDGVIKGIFTEHCLEHIPFETIDFLFEEFRRILKPRGLVRIVVPDGELYIRKYIDYLDGLQDVELPYAERDVTNGFYHPIMSVNRIFRSLNHLFIYDFDCLQHLLKHHGFRNIERKSYMSSQDPHLLIDTEKRVVESLYVEASK